MKTEYVPQNHYCTPKSLTVLDLIKKILTVIVWSSYGLRKRWNFPALAFGLLFINHCERSDTMLSISQIICSNLIPVTKEVVSSA